MAVNSPRLFSLLRVLLLIVLIIGAVRYLSSSKTDYREHLRRFRDEKKLFVADYLEHEIDGAFDGSAIRKLCASKQWTKGLILSCDPATGGVGEVKNAHLHCIRFAIELGAELILPRIIKRSESDISNLTPNKIGPPRGVSLEHFFDGAHLNHTLSTSCPQMRLHISMDDLYNEPNLLKAAKFDIANLTDQFILDGMVIERPELIAEQLNSWMDEQSPPAKRRYPIRFQMAHTLFRWPTEADGLDIASHFGRVLRVRPDIRRIAASGLFNMQKRFGLKLDPRSGIRRDAFVGVHLRTEADAEGIFANYETQAANYVAEIVDNQIPLVYVATGDTGDNVTALAARLRDFEVTTLLKNDVLDGQDLAAMRRLTWDQRALVDYEIMLRCSLMLGLSDSAFSWNLAMRRANAYRSHGEAPPVEQRGDIQYQDRFSTLFGRSNVGKVYRATIWP